MNRTGSTVLSLSARMQRVQAIRRRARLQTAASAAGWVAGSAGLLIVTVGGIISLAVR